MDNELVPLNPGTKAVAVIGSEGVVGSAISRVFWEGGFSIYCADPKLPRPCIRSHGEWPEIVKETSIGHKLGLSGFCSVFESEVEGPKVIFVAVPTPYSYRFDSSYLDEVLESISSSKFSGIVAIKSTVPPRIIDNLANTYKSRYTIVACPEFLNAATAYSDFKSSTHVVVGGDSKASGILAGIHAHALPNIAYHWLDTPGAAMMVKYSINGFFALKNSFFNTVKGYCVSSGYDYSYVVAAVTADSRITKTHTEVPGPDGHPGFAGACLPKDSLTMRDFFDQWFKEEGIDINNVLASVVEMNRKLRPEAYKDKNDGGIRR